MISKLGILSFYVSAIGISLSILFAFYMLSRAKFRAVLERYQAKNPENIKGQRKMAALIIVAQHLAAFVLALILTAVFGSLGFTIPAGFCFFTAVVIMTFLAIDFYCIVITTSWSEWLTKPTM